MAEPDSTPPGYPPLHRVQARFENGKLLVNSGLLKREGVSLVAGKLTRLRRRSGRALVWTLGKNVSLEPAKSMWDKLELNDQKDLYIVFNGADWYIRGWGLSPQQTAKALEARHKGLDINWAHGLLAVLTELEVMVFQEALETDSELQPESTTLGSIGLAVCTGLLGGSLAWLIKRRIAKGQSPDVSRTS